MNSSPILMVCIQASVRCKVKVGWLAPPDVVELGNRLGLSSQVHLVAGAGNVVQKEHGVADMHLQALASLPTQIDAEFRENTPSHRKNASRCCCSMPTRRPVAFLLQFPGLRLLDWPLMITSRLRLPAASLVSRSRENGIPHELCA